LLEVGWEKGKERMGMGDGVKGDALIEKIVGEGERGVKWEVIDDGPDPIPKNKGGEE
jgi:hypothetical protein